MVNRNALERKKKLTKFVCREEIIHLKINVCVCGLYQTYKITKSKSLQEHLQGTQHKHWIPQRGHFILVQNTENI